jgi:small subunit ribosomal protein S2
MKKDGTFMTLSKKERLQVDRRAKLEKNLGSFLICQDYQPHYL